MAGETLSALGNVGNNQAATDQLMFYAGLVNAAVKRNGTTNAVSDMTSGALNPATFYSLQLLDTIRDAADRYQYFKYAKAMPIEGKADTFTVRRWAPLQAHTQPLAEGVVPISDKGSVEVYDVKTNSYGRFMEFTDKVEWNVVDPVLAHYSAEYSIVAVETLDLLARNMLITCAQKWFAPKQSTSNGVTTITAVSAMSSIDETCKPRIEDFRLMSLAFKRAKVKPVDSTYHALVSPEFCYDMLDDPYVQKYMTINQTTGKFFDDGASDGVLIPMFGFSFHEVPNVSCSTLYKDGTTTKFLEVAANGTISGKAVGTAVSGYVNDKRTGKAASYIPSQVNMTTTAGSTIFKVNHIIVLGADALVRTGLSGEDQVKMYAKPLGSSGVLDPLDQRQSIGFKINSVGFASTRLEAIIDYICVPSQLNGSIGGYAADYGMEGISITETPAATNG